MEKEPVKFEYEIVPKGSQTPDRYGYVEQNSDVELLSTRDNTLVMAVKRGTPASTVFQFLESKAGPLDPGFLPVLAQQLLAYYETPFEPESPLSSGKETE